MKKRFIIFVFIGTLISINAQKVTYTYNNGNGSLIEQVIEGDTRISTIKHEDILQLYSVSHGWRANGENTLNIYESPDFDSMVIYTIPEEPEISTISTHLFRFEENLATNRKDSWLYVSTEEGMEGWLYLGLIFNPYREGRWSILEVIQSNNTTWTIRRFENNFVRINPPLNAQNEPGVSESSVLFTFYEDVSVEILEITEEVETIHGMTDHWIKVKDDQGRTGWVFGGFTWVAMGGFTLPTPDRVIRFEYGFP